MSQQLISRSPDLKRLRDEGYDLSIRGGYLVLNQVPYLSPSRQVNRGTLVSELTMAGDITARPATHVVYFAGETPCHGDGRPLAEVIISSGHQVLADGVEIDHTFSSKPPAGYPNYYEKLTTYAAILASGAHTVEPGATAAAFPVTHSSPEDGVFEYLDTSTSRANIGAISGKLEVDRIAIVGLGGTGSYVLDLLAKTPVRELHIFDGDTFLQHNAFRAPGAASVEELRERLPKVTYYQRTYAKMRRGIVAHPEFVTCSNAVALRDMNFVFLCNDGGDKRGLAALLEELGVPFIDVGMGIYEVEGALAGTLRVTTSTSTQRRHVWERNRIPEHSGGLDDLYATNIQVADLNALNAALAVIRWKRWLGFYHDQEREYFSAYAVDGNCLINEDQA